MSSIRQEKAASLILRELSMLFQREAASMFRGAMISVTVVRMSPDLKVAKVYLSFFGVADKQGMLKLVQSQQQDIRRRIGMNLRNQMRHMPEYHFYIDDSLDYAEEINSLLGKDRPKQ